MVFAVNELFSMQETAYTTFHLLSKENYPILWNQQ